MKVGDWVRLKGTLLEFIVRKATSKHVWIMNDDDDLIKLEHSDVSVIESPERRYEKISPHYTENTDGKDYLQRFFESETPEAVRGAMVFTIGKYIERLGKKDAAEKELAKVIDYATRYREYLLTK